MREVIEGEPEVLSGKRVEMNAERPANRSVRYCGLFTEEA